jgi:radical SAM/Cys-rich protein
MHRSRTGFRQKLDEHGSAGLHARTLDTLQVNTGLLCNQQCFHCHVESSPHRKELMSWEVMESVVRAARRTACRLVDITGGAPELHPCFRRFVEALRAGGHEVQVRTNLTVLVSGKAKDLPGFFRDHRVRLVASLPCYLESNVDRQRGDGVFDSSIRALRILNEVGYGADPELRLDLVYNPVGPTLPPPQDELEREYRRELDRRYGVAFTRLLTITNMPIGRFLEDLEAEGRGGEYGKRLADAFNPETLEGLMCRHQVSVRWDGVLFDCDFNLALGLQAETDGRPHIDDLDPEAFRRRRIATADHCFGCTAGAGSSCGGALVSR